MHEARAFAFRQKATQAYQKAMRPNITDETRRAWLIVERDWIKMAERSRPASERSGSFDAPLFTQTFEQRGSAQ